MSKEKASVLAKRYRLSRTRINKWRARFATVEAPMGPRDQRSTVLTPEAIIVAFRQRTLLPLDGVMSGEARGSIMRMRDVVATEGACVS